MLTGIRRLRHGPPAPPEWSVVPGGWPSSGSSDAAGWAHDSIAAAQRRKWPKFLDLIRAPRPLSVSHEAPEPDGNCVASHNAIVSYGYALALAAGGAARLSILDFGCGAGHYLPLSRELLPGVEFDYTGYDLPHLCGLAREFNPDATFFDTEAECWRHRYDFVLSSSSLQYVRDWRETLRGLASCTRGHLFITRLPTVSKSPAFVVSQRVHAYGYDTEYPGWVFNRDELLQEARDSRLSLVREFLMMDAPVIGDAPEQVRYRGFLFSRTAQPDDV